MPHGLHSASLYLSVSLPELNTESGQVNGEEDGGEVNEISPRHLIRWVCM